MAYFTYKNLLLLPILLAGVFSVAAKDGSMPGNAAKGTFNYTSFTSKSPAAPAAEWLIQNPQYINHPDAAYQNSNDGYVEVFGKRTEKSSYYIKSDDPGSFAMDQSSGPMHYRKDGQWLKLDGHLSPKGNNVFEASHQAEPLGFDVSRKAAYINTVSGKVYCNNWTLSGKSNGLSVLLANADWSQYTVGDDGVYITNIFPGIDAEMRVRVGKVKTNFIVHRNSFSNYDELAFNDAFSGAGTLQFAANSSTQVGDVFYKIGGKNVLHIDKAIAYLKNNQAAGNKELKYKVSSNELSVLVSSNYLNQSLAGGDVVIDPQLSVVATLPVASITGSMNCGSATNSCDFNLPVTPPPGATITKVYNRFSIFVVSGVTYAQSWFGMGVNGGCKYAYNINAATTGPAIIGTKDTASTAIGFDSVTSTVLSCLPPPSCNPAPIIFTVRLWNLVCSSGTGCSTTFNYANENFVVRILGNTLEATKIVRSSNTTICQGTSVTLTRNASFGGQPYKYTWLPTGDTTPSITVTPNVTTKYTSTVTDGCGNVFTDTTTIFVVQQGALPAFTGPIRLCQFDAPASLATRVTGTNLKWYSTPTGSIFTTIAPTPPTNVPGTYNYYVTQTTICGESPRVQVTVIVNEKPAPPGVTSPLRLCQYDTVVLAADGLNTRWYLHPTGGGGITPFSPPTGGVNDSTYYYATQTVNGCESDRSRLLVTVTYKPNGIISPSRLALCQDELDTFFYYGNARPDAVYNWVNPKPNTTEISGAGTQGPYVVRFDSSGTYNISVQVNNRGCLSDIAYQPVTVRVRPAIRFVAKEDACVDEIVNVALSYISPNIDSFRYQFAGGTIHYGAASGGPYGVSFATPGLKVISNTAFTKGCPSRLTQDTINVHPYPDARFTVTATSGGSTFCNGDSLVLTARTTDSNDHFVWMPDNFFTSGNLYTAKGFLTKSGYVKLQLTSRYGCISSDSLYVQTESCCRVFFPNAFSPNNDQKNDRFRPVSRGHHEVKTFRIINRWGQVVYESKDEVQGWDGTYNGKDQDVGTYYYYLSYNCGEGTGTDNRAQLEEKGEFLLIR